MGPQWLGPHQDLGLSSETPKAQKESGQPSGWRKEKGIHPEGTAYAKVQCERGAVFAELLVVELAEVWGKKAGPAGWRVEGRGVMPLRSVILLWGLLPYHGRHLPSGQVCGALGCVCI